MAEYDVGTLPQPVITYKEVAAEAFALTGIYALDIRIATPHTLGDDDLFSVNKKMQYNILQTRQIR